MSGVRRTRVPFGPLAEGRHVLPHETAHYLTRVLRLRDGAALRVFDGSTRSEADATLEVDAEGRATLVAGAVEPGRVLGDTELTLVYALSKGDKVDAVVRDATELGATLVIIARTERSVVKADEAKAESKLTRFRRVAEQAARQCGRADTPSVQGVFDWRDALAAARENAERCFCLDVRGEGTLAAPLSEAVAGGRTIAFAVGSEGGLTDREVDDARALGFAIVSLGRFVLRTETVAAAVLGAVRVLSP